MFLQLFDSFKNWFLSKWDSYCDDTSQQDRIDDLIYYGIMSVMVVTLIGVIIMWITVIKVGHPL